MNALFLGVLLIGLLLGVFAMLHGTERHPQNITLPAPHERVTEHLVDAEPYALFNWASLAAFAFAGSPIVKTLLKSSVISGKLRFCCS